jgi:Fanconi anemia group M protein
MGEGKVTVIVDRRESGSNVLRWLRELVNVEMRSLDAGDYVVSTRIGIERKSVDDFLQSIVDRRLIRQMRELSELYERPVLILEGRELFSRRLIHPNAIRGALASLIADMGVSVVSTEDEEDSARLIAALARREQVEERREVASRAKPRRPEVHELQRFVVEGLPGVSCVLAVRLLKRFGTVEGIVLASEKELMEVPGIGRKKARAIREVLSSPYAPEQDG